MKYILSVVMLCMTFMCQAQRSDSTLAEIKDPAYHTLRRAILAPFKPIRDSIFNSQPNWRDSAKLAIKDTSTLTKQTLYHRYVRLWDAEREVMRIRYEPFADRLNAFNKYYRVVGDMKDQRYVKTEQ